MQFYLLVDLVLSQPKWCHIKGLVVRLTLQFPAHAQHGMVQEPEHWLTDQAAHTVTRQFPLKNSANQITHINMGKNKMMMDTRLTQVKIVGSVAYNTEVDINVNTAYPWSTTGDPNAYDFQNCFTHELGHLLGLNDENSKSDSTMYSVTSVGETKKRTLAQDDKNGIGVIY